MIKAMDCHHDVALADDGAADDVALAVSTRLNRRDSVSLRAHSQSAIDAQGQANGGANGDAIDVRRNLRAIVADGAAFSVMVGIGENYIAAFALAAGAGEVVAGLVTSAPLLAGALLQVISPWAVSRLRSNRRWVVLCAMLQAASLLPLAISAMLGGISTTLLFATTAVYWSASLAGGPAWNTWVGAIVPDRVRSRYFARRTRITQGLVLLGFLAGGILLQWGESQHRALLMFALIFTVASICRFVSAGFLASQNEPVRPALVARRHSLPQWLRYLRTSGQSRLLWYLILMQGAAQMASPYFAPYMLGNLKFSYLAYMIVIATALLAKSVASPLLGIIAHRCGTRRLLTIGGLAVIPLPLFWLVFTRPEHLVVIQVLSGVSWAAYELAVALLYFEAIAPNERTAVLTTLNVGHSLATVLGSLIGGAIIFALRETQTSYFLVFAFSSAVRLATLPLLARLQMPKPTLRVLNLEHQTSNNELSPRKLAA